MASLSSRFGKATDARIASSDAAKRERFLGPIHRRNDKKCYFRSTISIQFGCVPIG